MPGLGPARAAQQDPLAAADRETLERPQAPAARDVVDRRGEPRRRYGRVAARRVRVQQQLVGEIAAEQRVAQRKIGVDEQLVDALPREPRERVGQGRPASVSGAEADGAPAGRASA